MLIKVFTELRRRMYEYRENFNKEIKKYRKVQIEIITSLKNTLEGFNIRLDEVEE